MFCVPLLDRRNKHRTCSMWWTATCATATQVISGYLTQRWGLDWRELGRGGRVHMQHQWAQQNLTRRLSPKGDQHTENNWCEIEEASRQGSFDMLHLFWRLKHVYYLLHWTDFSSRCISLTFNWGLDQCFGVSGCVHLPACHHHYTSLEPQPAPKALVGWPGAMECPVMSLYLREVRPESWLWRGYVQVGET